MPEKTNEGDSTNYFKLESDQRFSAVARWFAEKARKKAKEHQARHIATVDAVLAKDPSVEFTAQIREPDASGENRLEVWLNENGEQNKVVFLLNGIINPQDIVQISPLLEKLGMAGLRIGNGTREKIFETLEEGVRKDTISGYVLNTIKKIQSGLLENKKIAVMLIFNASKEDILKAIEQGGENTVLAVGGHGTLEGVQMTDGFIKNEDIPAPKHKLRAFLQHTCAAPKGSKEKMGENWAAEVFGWERTTSPADFIDSPLHKRS